MSPVKPEAAWADFIRAFFSSPNKLSASGDEAIQRIIAQAEVSWLANPAPPFFLPVSASGWTYWYAICPDQQQQLWVRDLIRAHVGSWTDFSGQPVPEDSDLPMDRAVRALIGPGGCWFRLLIPRNEGAENEVRKSLARLGRSLAARPYRRIHLTQPLGRLIGDFWDACASVSQAGAEKLLDLLEQDHRLSEANKLFLRLQYLAVFEQWDRLEALDRLPDLIRLDRPVLASDALARLAMARLPKDASLVHFARATSAFGCLLGSVTSIRSAAGAQYYAYWALSSGETVEVVAARLLESGWLEHARSRHGLASLLTIPGAPDIDSSTAPDPDELKKALVEGRLDAAIDLMALFPPSTDLLPVLVGLVTKTLSSRSIELFQRWRQLLGEASIREIISGLHSEDRHEAELGVTTDQFGEAINHAFTDDLATAERTRALDNLRAQAVPRLMETGVLPTVVEGSRSLSQSVDPSLLPDLIDLLLDIERDLFGAAGDVHGIQDLRMLTVEAWALGDESGDRHRAGRLLDLVSRILETGVWHTVFDELAESLRAAWPPFLTDADLPLSLEAIEILAASKPQAAASLQAFATPILSRIGEHNLRRIDAASLYTAIALADEFGLELAIPSESYDNPPDGADQITLPSGTFVAIYSLMEPAARRAAAIIHRRYPEIRVEIFVEKVASDGLRYAARESDLLVIADKAAAHAATDALKAARGRKPIYYARGKGTVSLIEAALAGLKEISDTIRPESSAA